MKNVLIVASEAVPFIKTGGLADVIGSLPKYFNNEEYDVRVIMPKYTCISSEYTEKMTFLSSFYMNLGWRSQYVGIFSLKYDNVQFYFIDNEFYFAGSRPYGAIHEDIEKFAFFSKAVLSAIPLLSFKPDILHCNDWQTGLVPVFLKGEFTNNEYFEHMKSIITIHNLKFQGIWDVKNVQDITGLNNSFFTSDKLEAFGNSNYLKGGIVYSDLVTTVSPSYAQEIKTPFYGEKLEGLMKARGAQLYGILNGIDDKEYNPEDDPRIEHNYSVSTFRKEKWRNKIDLQKELNLDVDKKKFMIGIVSRLTDQKGFDLISYVMDELCEEDVQIVVLGTGDEKYENMFRHFDWKYSNRVSANIYYSEDISHRVYAACDAFLMPSLFEPCGLSQLISLRYGTVPVVRETGGLKDTIIPYNEYDGSGTGFSFANYNAHEMLSVVRYAKSIFYDKKREWNKIVDRGMMSDFSWNASAREYEKLYDQLYNQLS